MKKRIISTIIAVGMILSLSAITTTANDLSDFTIYGGTLANYNGTDEVVTIPDTVTAIGDYAFSSNKTLKSVIIHDSVLSIGGDAFYDCTNLESVVIGNGVESVGDYAFQMCVNMTSVTFKGEIPPTLGTGVFQSANQLKTIYVPIGAAENYAGLGSYTFVEKCMECGENPCECPPCEVCGEVPCVCDVFTIDENGVLTAYTGADGNITIPSGVTSIGDYAFIGDTTLVNVIIHDSVESIGDYAFSGCTSLESVTIGNNVETIGEYAFRGCTSLESVTIGNNVETIGEYAFRGCTSLESVVIGNKVESIGDNAFSGCTSLESVVIGNKVYSIGTQAFSSCTNLESVTFKSEAPPTFGATVFGGVTGVTVYVPIGSKTAYEGISQLSGFDIICMVCMEESCVCDVFTIDENGVLTEYTGADGNITIPKGATAIGNSAFRNNADITSVLIHDSVVSIGDYAFRECTNLESVTFMTADPPTFGVDVFVTGITIYVPQDAVNNYMIPQLSGFDIICILCMENPCVCDDFYIVDGVLTAYYGTGGDIIIPKGVTSILGASAVFVAKGTITSIVIHNGVKTMSDNAFRDCTNLKSVVIGNGVEAIGGEAFRGCTNLESVVIGNKVESIGDTAFRDCTNLKSILIPDSVKTIGENAFRDCTKLESVVIGNGVETIGNVAFWDCTSLTSVTFKSNTPPDFGANVFFNVTDLTVYVPISAKTEYEKISQLSGFDIFELCEVCTTPADWTDGTEATCTEASTRVKNCTVCGYILESESQEELGHTEVTGIWTSGTAATCETASTRIETCARENCTHTIATETQDALGHDFIDNWEITLAPTCIANGERERSCTRNCGETRTETITTRPDHDYELIGTTATCIDDGIDTLECTTCSDAEYESREALGHAFTNYTGNTATCIAGGVETATCDRGCGEEDELPTSALGHIFTNYTGNTATCTAGGVETATCDRTSCNEQDELPTSPLDHDFQNYESDDNATCTAHGTETGTCVRCDETNSRMEIDSMLPHTPKTENCTECSVCDETGLTRTCTTSNPCTFHTPDPDPEEPDPDSDNGGGSNSPINSGRRPTSTTNTTTTTSEENESVTGTEEIIIDVPVTVIREIAGNLPTTQIAATAAGTQLITTAAANAGQNAVLLVFNEETGEFEVVSAATVGADGTATVNIPGAGDYIVVVAQTGDLTGTGTVTAADALLLLQALTGNAELNPLQKFLTSSRSDSKFTATDALNILKFVAGMIDEL
ncbi:MAG: leucine-rich repeat domain-containing protein [Oscillospiraceae bacterium]|nr:leucine-rich repeat domain-containing protein [Oscillospiraceae bacterium]